MKIPSGLLSSIPVQITTAGSCAVIQNGTTNASLSGYTAGIDFPALCSVAVGTPFSVRGILSATVDYDSTGLLTTNVLSGVSTYTLHLPFTYKHGAWIKLKDTSYTRATTGNFVNHLPYVIDRFHPEQSAASGGGDESDALGTVPSTIGETSAGSGGFIAASMSDLSPAGVSSPTNQWQVTGYHMNTTAMVSATDQYITRIINTQGTTSVSPTLGSVTLPSAQTIYTLKTDGTGSIGVGSITATGPNMIIVVKPDNTLGDLIIGSDNSENAGLIIIAKSITFAPSVTAFKGILITTGVVNAGGGGAPLKIKGNVVAAGGMTGIRSRTDADHARPSVFIEFDMDAYQKLLPLISTSQIKYRE